MDRARLILLLALLWPLCLSAAPLPDKAPETHMGVATCASSVCHGAISPKQESNVLQNEYRTWSMHDRHAQAYKTLLSDESREIARKLGLKNAHEEKICLDCHADNVPAGKRGRRYQLSDGVGCEACHGGAEKWLKSHTEPDATHADNLAKGMYPTEDPLARGELCLSCHLGNQDKLATHAIMGAGHPRLSFELDTFTVLQPEHYVVDDDYLRRKGPYKGGHVWIAGQFVAAAQTLDLLASERFVGAGLFPEISLFDCHSCHHPMNDQRWQKSEGLPPGAMRLNDGYLQLSGLILSVLEPALAERWTESVRRLHTTTLTGTQAVSSQAATMKQEVRSWLGEHARALTTDQSRALMKKLLKESASGRLRDYSSAEQVVMGVSVLVTSLQRDDELSGMLDRLYAALEDEHGFKPGRFASAAAKALKDLEKGQ